MSQFSAWGCNVEGLIDGGQAERCYVFTRKRPHSCAIPSSLGRRGGRRMLCLVIIVGEVVCSNCACTVVVKTKMRFEQVIQSDSMSEGLFDSATYGVLSVLVNYEDVDTLSRAISTVYLNYSSGRMMGRGVVKVATQESSKLLMSLTCRGPSIDQSKSSPKYCLLTHTAFMEGAGRSSPADDGGEGKLNPELAPPPAAARRRVLLPDTC